MEINMKRHPLTGRFVALVVLGSISGIAAAGTATRPAHKIVVPTTATILHVAARSVAATLHQSSRCYSNLNALKSGGARRTARTTDDRYRCRNCTSNIDHHYVRHHFFW